MTLIGRHPFGPRLVVEKHRLDNGLGILLVSDRSAPVVAYHTWLRVGSRHEPPGRTGMAHLFEHLMFNRTEHLAAGELDQRMEALGGESNAATWVDWTFYHDVAPAAALPSLVELEAERMQHLVLDHDEVESEREVVLNERRERVDDDVEGRLAEEVYRLAFARHPYGHPTIGWREDIAAITIDDARAFYRTYYAPNNATLVVVGDFEPAAALGLIAAAYGPMAPAPIPTLLIPAEPPQGGERRAQLALPVASERIVFGYKAPAQTHEDWIPLLVLNEILLGGPSSRLYRELVVAHEVASSVQGALAPFSDPGLYELFVGMKRDQPAARAEDIVDRCLEAMRAAGPNAAELATAKNRLETEHWAELETADGKAEALGHHESTGGDHLQLFEVARRVEAVSADDVVRVARRYLVTDARTLVVVTPSEEEEEEEEE
jgi:zinc protease